MYIGYITLLKLCIKGTYSSQPMVCLQMTQLRLMSFSNLRYPAHALFQ